MTREFGKSVLLALLVLLSLVLTWFIWTYQGDYESIDPNQSQDIPKIDMSYDLSEVIVPYLLIHKSPNAFNGSMQQSLVDNAIYKELLKAKWTIDVGTNNPPKQNGDSYELLFSAPVTMDTINELFNFTQTKTRSHVDLLIDRLELYQDTSMNHSVLVFKDGDGDPRFYATSGNLAFKKVKSWVEKANLMPYYRVNFNNKRAYLPAQRQKIDGYVYSYQTVSMDRFKPIFFNDPDKVSYDKKKQVYSNESSLLESYNDILKYVNLSATSSDKAMPSDPIIQSYNFIESHQGWTDDYMYFGLDKNLVNGENGKADSTVTFRLSEGGLPVFNTNLGDKATITMTWMNGQTSPQKVTRTLLNVADSSYQSNPEDVPSAKEIVESLKAVNTPINRIENLVIGYRMELDTGQHVVKYHPEWFLKKNGQWWSVSDYIKNANRNPVIDKEEAAS
ncbi:YycH family regulatory protein [Camelliibacillus cellulosilyticus]|uniref:YycH family regulatory protein n=1 Tax=Camelliibacillus cellulosilyticus TaxID=2174486 RepID=A0ABV9GQ17_9BACL